MLCQGWRRLSKNRSNRLAIKKESVFGGDSPVRGVISDAGKIGGVVGDIASVGAAIAAFFLMIGSGYPWSAPAQYDSDGIKTNRECRMAQKKKAARAKKKTTVRGKRPQRGQGAVSVA